MTDLSERVIPQLFQERHYVAAKAQLDQLVAMRPDTEGTTEVRQAIQLATTQAKSSTQRGDDLLAAHKPADALVAYQEAVAVCADFEAAVTGVARATLAVSKARNRRRAMTATGVAVLVITLVGMASHVINVQMDERGWTTVTTAAKAAGANYEAAIQQYRQYLDRFPQGRHSANAKELVEVTLPQQMDDHAWKEVGTATEAAGANYEAAIQQYRQYLDRFPQGRHSANAKELVEVTLPQQMDDQAWKTASTASEATGGNNEQAIQQYRQYLDRFPQGRHASVAKELVEITLPKQIIDRESKLSREREYQTAVKDASKYFQLKDWVNTDHAIKRALEMKPDDVESAQLKEMQQKMADDLREQQYQEQLSHAQASLASGEPEAAVEFCRVALVAKPNDPGALQLLRDATESSKRAKTYGNAMNEARSLLDQQKWKEALAAVDTALSTVAGDKTALLLKDKIKESEVDAHYQEAMRDAKSHMDKQEWDSASSSCNKALMWNTQHLRWARRIH